MSDDANDDLADVLDPKPGALSSTFRDALLRQTESRLTRYRWQRRGVRWGAVAGVFVAGGLTGWLVRPLPPPECVTVIQRETVEVPVPVVVPVPIPAESRSSETPEVAKAVSGPDLELQAEQADGAASWSLYKSAGDVFLRDQDYANAARCYRLFLIRSGDAALSLTPDDSWLLMFLKNAAYQEKSYVQKSD